MNLTVTKLIETLSRMPLDAEIVLQPEGQDSELIPANVIEQVWMPDNTVKVLISIAPNWYHEHVKRDS